MSANLPWPSGAFGDFATFRNGINFSKTQKGEVGTATIDVQNMYGNGAAVRLDRLYKVNKNLDDDHLLKSGDLLFVRSSLKREGVGWTALFTGAPHPISFCGFIIRARLSSKSPFDPLFLTYFFRSDRAREWLVSGSERVAITNISQDVLQRLAVPMPPLEEQRQIAAALSAVQRAIERQERLIALTAELKKALMHQLFTHGTRREPLKQTEIGPVPTSWLVEQCGDLCVEISVGVVVRPRSYYVDKGVPAFRSLNVREDRLDATDTVFFSQDSNDGALSKSKLRTGDVLIVRTGYPGTSCVVPKEYDGSNCIDLVFARPRPQVSSEYLSRFFNSHAGKSQATAAKHGLAQQHLNVGAVKRVLVPVPARAEQELITDALAAVDAKAGAHQRSMRCCQSLFRTLLHQLMTAQLRVRDLDLSALGVEENAKELAGTT